MRYRINTPSIIYEILDHEAVILNLDEGVYYSLGGSGNDIWEMLKAHLTVNEMTSRFQSNQEREVVQEKIEAFVHQLVQQKLLVEASEAFAEDLNRGEQKEFSQPVLHIFEDMKELLLLDPIHEVDQAGWPVAP